MVFRRLAGLAALLFVFQCHGAQTNGVALNSATLLRFASVEEGRDLLGSHDAFTASLSAFDRSARTNSGHSVSEEEFLAFASGQALPWSAAEMRRMQDVIEPIGRRMYDKGLHFPPNVLLVKSSGEEEGNAPYHRGNAIVLPISIFTQSGDTLHQIIVHELFHVLTSTNPELKQALYQTIGFSACGILHLPPGLAARKITNPDAPALDQCASVGRGAEAEIIFPVLLASDDRYEPARKTGLAAYIALDLVVAERHDGAWRPKYVDGVLPRLDREQFRSFVAQIGSNTSTSAHPEEILADNFVLLVDDVRNVPTPRVIAAIDRVLGWSRQRLAGP